MHEPLFGIHAFVRKLVEVIVDRKALGPLMMTLRVSERVVATSWLVFCMILL